MIQTIKKQFQIQWENWIWELLVIFGAGIFGLGLHWFIVRNDETVDTCFAMGTVMAIMMVLIFLTMMSFSMLGMYFNVEISMGCTRMQFFLSYYIFNVVFSLAGLLAVMAWNLMENRLLEMWYPTMQNEIYFMPYLVKYGLPAAVLIPIVAIFGGSLVMRYGRKILLVIWVLYMLAALVIPTILEYAEEAPDTIYGRIGVIVMGIFGKIPVNVWGCLGVVVIAVSFIGSWTILRKQQVTA